MTYPLFSTAYLPPILWMALAGKTKHLVIELGESYPKQSFRNRCEIAMPSGKMDLSIPIKKPYGSKTKSYDILIDKTQNWQRHHLRSLETAYSASPFYMYYIDELIALLHTDETLLYKLNAKLIQWLMDNLGITCQCEHSLQFSSLNTQAKDFRFAIHPKKDKNTLLTISEPPIYQQVFTQKYNFLPWLSSIDVLFNLGPEAGYYIQNLPIIN